MIRGRGWNEFISQGERGMQKTLLWTVGIGLVSVVALAAPASKVKSVQLPPAAFAEMKGIDPERIRAHVRFLS